MPKPTKTHSSMQVWDLFVRLFHWSLVTCVFLNLWVLEEGEDAHQFTGYVTVSLVLARIVWGFVGSRHARFSDFLPTPARVAQHLQALMRKQVPHATGHNPLGALMMLFLLTTILLLGLTGWLQTTDAYFDQEWLEELHEVLANVLMLSAGLHALAAILMGRLGRVRLVRAMFTGRKDPL